MVIIKPSYVAVFICVTDYFCISKSSAREIILVVTAKSYELLLLLKATYVEICIDCTHKFIKPKRCNEDSYGLLWLLSKRRMLR